ncbi:MAG: guanylate kinase [Candidatus Latescibacteria bacterium]|mgnify:CR=1 FL=1|nr:guanylate kinase [Candidatus Latescibacterota bacterium]
MKGNNKSTGLLVVVSAPSGAGKTSVLSEVMRKFPDINFSVSVTTRPPREGERDGVNYFFVTDEEFEALIERDDFVEWAVVHGNRYGTLKSTVQDALDNNRTIILDTDTVGAFNIKKHFPDTVLIFIAPPSQEALRERLESRNTESRELIQKRLDAAPGEMARMAEYDYIVLNETLSNAAAQIGSIIEANN